MNFKNHVGVFFKFGINREMRMKLSLHILSMKTIVFQKRPWEKLKHLKKSRESGGQYNFIQFLNNRYK